nr:Na+/H+ antiporter [Anaerolineae bacterium]
MDSFEMQLIGLIIIAVFVAITAQRARIPYTVAMVLTGLLAGMLFHARDLGVQELNEHLILVTFLPGLVFEAAFHLDLSDLRDNLKPIVIFAIPGVVLSVVIIGLPLTYWLDIPLAEALLFGALISATDPIAVVALFKELGVTKRLSIIMEGESLFNDGAAIVLFSILAGVASGEHTFSLSQSLLEFFVTVAGGAALGLVVGLLAGELMRRTEDPKLDIALTAVVAYGTYLFAAEVLHETVSPVIAVVVAGIYVGNFGSRGEYSATSQNTIISFWEFMAFMINSAIFLLIGLNVDLPGMIANLLPVLIGIAVILATRAIVVYLLRFWINTRTNRLPLKWAHVLFWGGLRGAVSMALALSISAALTHHELLKQMAFAYVLFSLVIQALTIRPLLSWLGLTKSDESALEFELIRGRLALSHASISAVDELREQQLISGAFAAALKRVFLDQMEEHTSSMGEMLSSKPSLAKSNALLVEREVAAVQRQTLGRLMRKGIISEEAHDLLARQIDERERKRIEGSTEPGHDADFRLPERVDISHILDQRLVARESPQADEEAD